MNQPRRHVGFLALAPVLNHGVDLLLCVNPLVPVDTERAARLGAPVGHTVRDLGLPAVMEQTFRTMIRSRMAVGMSTYARRYPDSEIVLVEPDTGDPDLFFRNTFSFRDRGHICLSGWTTTREYLRRKSERLRPAFDRHGIRLREDLLDDPDVHFWDGIGIDPDEGRGSYARRLSILLDRVEKIRGQVT